MILVTTPNGKVGQEVVKGLLERGETVRLAAHTPQKAQDAFPDAEVVPFEFGDEESVRAALQGVGALYLASPGAMAAEPVEQVIDLAKEAGVERVVRLSAMGVEHSDNPLRRVEQHLEASGLAWTLLRPNWFMQNYSTTNAQSVRDGGVIAEPVGDAKTAFIDTRDIAGVAVRALTEEGHQGQAYALTGPEALNRHQVAKDISEATGKKVRYEPLSEEAFREQMGNVGMPAPYVGLMAGLYRSVRAGDTAHTTDAAERLLGRPPISFGRFAQDHKEVWLG